MLWANCLFKTKLYTSYIIGLNLSEWDSEMLLLTLYSTNFIEIQGRYQAFKTFNKSEIAESLMYCYADVPNKSINIAGFNLSQKMLCTSYQPKLEGITNMNKNHLIWTCSCFQSNINTNFRGFIFLSLKYVFSLMYFFLTIWHIPYIKINLHP